MLVWQRFAVLTLCVSSLSVFTSGVVDGQDVGRRLEKPSDDTDQNYTTVGSVGLTITNFGAIGDRNAYWPNQPSCEYPRGSRIEHLYQAGLWVGAVSRNTHQEHVSTGSSDRVAFTPRNDFEFTSNPGSTIEQLSTLSESPYFSEQAVSHQDFVAWYTDMNKVNPTTGDTIVNHEPLGLNVKQESYAWNYPFADFFVILKYTIYNGAADTLDSVYVGLWDNAVVRNTNNVRPGTPGFFNHGALGYLDSLRMVYAFDYDGIPTPPPADSYIGIKLLGTYPFPHGVDSLGNLSSHTFYNAWGYQSSSGDADYFSPSDDAASVGGARSKYDRLAASMPVAKFATPRPSNMTQLLSCGPFSSLAPGDSLVVTIGVICARKNGVQPASLDTRDQRKNLSANAALCQQAYDGEDTNGDNILEPGEDLNGNGILDHYQLPQPPRPPKVHADVSNQNVAIYWDKSTSEETLDPISRTKDFEGYRIYRSNAGADFADPANLLLNLSVVGDFDLANDNIGYNTGLSKILLDRPKTFPGDTVQYWYRFPPAGENIPGLNGWQYVYGVAAYDKGDSASGVASLQSATVLARVVPGTPPNDGSKKVGVYPNPYYANAVWDAPGERDRKIYFYNLPGHSEIRIYTLAGDVVAEFTHDGATYHGTDIDWFKRFGGTGGNIQFAGGEHAWDLVTKYDQALATGLYLFSVKDLSTGNVQTGKFLIIK